MSETWKLAAILVADIVGYSRLAGADEEWTLARLRPLRSDLIEPSIALHHDRIVKRTGDGSIIEFRSVVDAVRCAVEVESGMVERNGSLCLRQSSKPTFHRNSRPTVPGKRPTGGGRWEGRGRGRPTHADKYGIASVSPYFRARPPINCFSGTTGKRVNRAACEHRRQRAMCDDDLLSRR
jgi:hypothetical protein